MNHHSYDEVGGLVHVQMELETICQIGQQKCVGVQVRVQRTKVRHTQYQTIQLRLLSSHFVWLITSNRC